MHRDDVRGVYLLSPNTLAPGDGLHWAAAPGFPEHFETVIDFDPVAMTVTVVAGGERDGSGNETVKKITRRLVQHGTGLADNDNHRVLAAKIDADAMARVYGLRAAA